MAYVTIDEVKAQLQITGTSHDDRITLCADAATAQIEEYTNRVWESADAADRFFEPSGRRVLAIAEAQSIVSVSELSDGSYDALTLSDEWQPTGTGIDPTSAAAPAGTAIAEIERTDGSRWNTTVKVNGVFAATASPPDDIKQAALILATRLFQRHAAPLGLSAGGADSMAIRLSRVDPDVATLLMPHRRIAVG